MSISRWAFNRTLADIADGFVEKSSPFWKGSRSGLRRFLKKAFDNAPHEFGVTGSLLELIRNYLSGRQQFTVLNGVKSDLLPVSMGILRRSVLGPTLLVLFTNDLPSSVPTGSVYMYADDTTIFCVGETAALAISQLNKSLREFYNWCQTNRLTPYPSKSEVILFTKGTPMGPIASVYLGNSVWLPRRDCED